MTPTEFDTSNFDYLKVFENQNGVVTVKLNRPKIHNAFDDQLIKELTNCFEILGKKKSVRVIVLTGEGRSFCAGADVQWMQRAANYSFEENLEDAKELAGLFYVICTCPKPVVGRINGAAIGGGSGIVSTCDIAVAVERARFAFSEVNLGIVPAVISPFVFSKIGARGLKEFFLTGARFDAQRAKEIGLINYITKDEEELDKKVEEIVQQLLQSGPQAITEVKKLTDSLSGILDEDFIDATIQMITKLRSSEEGKEGLRSFLEKRSPNWVPKENG